MSDVKAELDQLIRTFLGAFTNTGGTRPDVDVIREVFIPQGMIISNVGASSWCTTSTRSSSPGRRSSPMGR